MIKNIFLTILLFNYCFGYAEFDGDSVNLNYCEIEKLFCRGLRHVACFDEIKLSDIWTSVGPNSCIYDFKRAVEKTRLSNGFQALQWNQEFESFAMLSTNVPSVSGQCGISLKYLDTRFFTVKVGESYSQKSFKLSDNRVLIDPSVTDIGCACKRINGNMLVFCWYNYSGRVTSIEFENLLKSANFDAISL